MTNILWLIFWGLFGWSLTAAFRHDVFDLFVCIPIMVAILLVMVWLGHRARLKAQAKLKGWKGLTDETTSRNQH